jgi:hypothetical protein
LPATDAISPLTRASPLAGACADEVIVGEATPVLGDIGDVVGLDVFDEPHAAMDSAVTPVTARIANRASRGAGELADINVSPIVGGPNERVYPLELCGICVFRTRIRRGA